VVQVDGVLRIKKKGTNLANSFSTLEMKILAAKGLTGDHLEEEEDEVEIQVAGAKPEKRAPRQEPEMPPMPPLTADLDDPAVADAVAAYQAQAMQNNAAAQLKLGLAYHVGRSAPADPKLECF
jgi:hypothetical protein